MSFEKPWRPELDWNAPAGRVFDRLVAALPASRKWEIIVFGSSPLQLGLDACFVSGDVDVIPDEDITAYCDKARLLKGQAPIYVKPCASIAFTASPDWFVRAFRCERQHVVFTFPHPIDILISKIKRLEEKEKTGHSTEQELVVALQRVVDLYRPAFDEETAGNPFQNTQTLWRELFGQTIDVRLRIIEPALEQRRRAYAAPPLKKPLSGL